MSIDVPVLHEAPRGCGHRKAGGIYLVSGELSEPCPRLPVETTTCPTCGEGIRPARGFAWVDGAKLVPPEHHSTPLHDRRCPLSPARVWHDVGEFGEEIAVAEGGGYVSRLGRCGLIWIGEQFYPTPQSFMAEAEAMGVSRRIAQVPRDFVVGETWVLLAHRKAVVKQCPECDSEPWPDEDCPVCKGTGRTRLPGVITAFQPTAIEYVVKGDETEEDLERLVERGLSPVKVVPVEEQLAVPS